MMQLSDETLQLLKNFAQINSNFLFTEGTELKTMADAKNVYAVATSSDTFTKTFGIYDLNEFLSVLNLVETPQLDFKDKYVTISDSTGKSSVKYYYTDQTMLTYPEKSVKLPKSFELEMDVESSVLARLITAASTLGHSHVSISPKNDELEFVVFDEANSTSNNFSMLIPGKFDSNVDFQFVLNVNNLRKLISSDYELKISSKLISVFKAKNSHFELEYYIALEKSSKYGV